MIIYNNRYLPNDECLLNIILEKKCGISKH